MFLRPPPPDAPVYVTVPPQIPVRVRDTDRLTVRVPARPCAGRYGRLPCPFNAEEAGDLCEYHAQRDRLARAR